MNHNRTNRHFGKRFFQIFTALIFGSVAILWGWNTLAVDLFSQSSMRFKHALALELAILSVLVIALLTWKVIGELMLPQATGRFSQSVRVALVRQFGKPRGWLGHLAGFIMARRSSNYERAQLTLDLLDLHEGQKILEFGSGPGVALKSCIERIGSCRVVGIDHSSVMITQARRQLVDEIASGRVELRHGSLDLLAGESSRFDRIYSLNVVQFLPSIQDAVKVFFEALADGGRLATTYQPRLCANEQVDRFEMAIRVQLAMETVGFKDIEVHELPLEAVPAVCVTGVKKLGSHLR